MKICIEQEEEGEVRFSVEVVGFRVIAGRNDGKGVCFDCWFVGDTASSISGTLQVS